jgi:4-alpha-glucanotransferase
MVSEPAVGQRLGAAYSEEGNMPDWHKGRRAGVLLHPTSLPGPNGIGELGKEAFKFVDWLRSAGMQCWQVLPLVPPDPKYYSPYSGLDTNCGNPLVIDLEALITEGLLDAADRPAAVPEGDVQFEKVAAVKQPLLSKAVQTLMSGAKFAGLRQSLAEFRAVHPRLEDSALFDVLRQQPDLADLYWWEWPEPLRCMLLQQMITFIGISDSCTCPMCQATATAWMVPLPAGSCVLCTCLPQPYALFESQWHDEQPYPCH